MITKRPFWNSSSTSAEKGVENSELSRVFTDLIEVMDIALWELDLEYRVVALNRKAKEIYGEDVVGDFCYHAAAGLDTVCPGCPAEMVYGGMDSGRSMHRREKAGGKVIYIDHIATPIRNPAGVLIGVLVLIIDITRHKVMEEELKAHRDLLEEKVSERTLELSESEARYRKLYEESKRSEQLYRSLLHSSADAITIYDMEGKVVYLSPAFTQTFGWSCEELLGKQFSPEFVPKPEQEETQFHLRNLLERGTPCRDFQTRRKTKDGRILEVNISASRYNDHQGRPAGVLVLTRDITQQKQLEAQVKHAERMEAIGTLAGGIAHDFNNLMMGIMGHVSLMRMGIPDNHPNMRRVDKIEKLIRQGSSLTTQLLGYARQGRYEIRPLSINSIIRETAEIFGRTHKEITILLDLADGINPVRADHAQMQQIFFNLFVNAADAMADGGDIRVISREGKIDKNNGVSASMDEKQHVLIEVADTGAGIDPKILGRIFDPFFTTKTMGRGTGLGLSSVYGIVKSHGGHLTADSVKGKGATFRIYLPTDQNQDRDQNRYRDRNQNRDREMASQFRLERQYTEEQ